MDDICIEILFQHPCCEIGVGAAGKDRHPGGSNLRRYLLHAFLIRASAHAISSLTGRVSMPSTAAASASKVGGHGIEAQEGAAPSPDTACKVRVRPDGEGRRPACRGVAVQAERGGDGPPCQVEQPPRLKGVATGERVGAADAVDVDAGASGSTSGAISASA